MPGWDWARIVTAGGRQYVAKRTGTAFMEMSREYATDEQADANTPGNEIVRVWSAHIPHEEGRPEIGTVIAECSTGIGRISGDGSDPVMAMSISFDQGQTFTTYRNAKMGELGAYSARVVWHRNGRGKRSQTILRFRVNEPVKFAIENIVHGETT